MSLKPFARSIKLTEAASSHSGNGVIQSSYRPKTWAMNGKRKKISTNGNNINDVVSYGGGPTPKGEVAAGLTMAGGAGAVLNRDRKQKKKVSKSAFGVDHEVSKAEKGPFRRPAFQNTRKENTKVGAAVGAGMWGGLGAAGGAGIGAHDAKRGIKVLSEVGAHPGRLRAAKLVAGNATKTGAALGVLGAASGAVAGSAIGATAGSKGGKLGELQRKQAIEVAHSRANKFDRKAAKARSNAQEFSKSAFGVNHELEKAWKGTKGDKRNTKYAAATIAGSQTGRRAGFKAAGTNQRQFQTHASIHGMESALNDQSTGQMLRSMHRVKGFKTGVAGDVAGTAAAAGAYHAYRKKKGIAKSAFGIER